MKKKILNGYSLPLVTIIITFLSFSLTITIVAVSMYLRFTSFYMKEYSDCDEYYEILEKILPEMGLGIRDEYTSPFDGWYSQLPSTIDDFEISYFPEDSKFDLNHMNLEKFFKVKKNSLGNSDNTTDTNITILKNKNNVDNTNEDASDDTDFLKPLEDNYLYYPDDIKDYINPDKEEEYKDILSIYNVPNLNTCDSDRLILYMETCRFDEKLVNETVKIVTNKRKQMKMEQKYLKYNSGQNDNKGLIINDNDFSYNIKPLSWPEDKPPEMLLDYKGNINLNFVDEKLFEIIVKACGPKNITYEKYWDKIKSFREDEKTIKEMDIKNIFQNDWDYFKKIFSIDSNLFKIEILKNDKKIIAFVRRYKDDRDKKIKIFKISVEKVM